MPTVPDTPVADASVRPLLSTKGLKPFDLNPDEMDDVTMRIFNELRKQLAMMENKKSRTTRHAGSRAPRPHPCLSRTHHGTAGASRSRTRRRAQKPSEQK